MKRLAFVAVILAFALCAHSSEAQDKSAAVAQENHGTGVQLLEECENVENDGSKLTGLERQRGMHCMGYLQGVADTLRFWRDYNNEEKTHLFPPACISNDATNFEFAKVVVKYLNDHPNKLHEGYGLLVIFALEDAYPCKH